MKKGEELEGFVQFVYSKLLELNDYKNVIVSRNVRIKGKSGTTNEFDVYYEFDHLNLRCGVVIECKEWEKPVDISVVRDFIQKMNDIEIGRIIGAIVSKNGYQSGAEQLAKSNGIKLLTIKDLPNFFELLSRLLEKSFLPDNKVIGDPFWTIMELDNNSINGNYYSISNAFESSHPVVPLFYSKHAANFFLQNQDKIGKYCVRGISQYHLKKLLPIAKFQNVCFALCVCPIIDEANPNLSFIKLAPDDILKEYYRTE